MEETGENQKENRVFGTTTQELEKLARWMEQHQVRQVAMESTGVYWRPVWKVLEGRFEIRLANAQHIRNLPGKKTDRKDGEWIAKLLQYDLVPASFGSNGRPGIFWTPGVGGHDRRQNQCGAIG
jgi:transposase